MKDGVKMELVVFLYACHGVWEKRVSRAVRLTLGRLDLEEGICVCGPAFIAFAVSLLDFGKTALSPADRRLPLSLSSPLIRNLSH